jgi:hypothetical protein
MVEEAAMAQSNPALVVDWKRPGRPQASLEKYAPEIEVARARRLREESRARGPPQTRGGRQRLLDDPGEAVAREVIALELKPASHLTEVYITGAGPARPARRSDERIRAALLGACEQGGARDVAVMAAARECAVPLSALSLVEGLLDDLILEDAIVRYGSILYAGRRRGRKLVAVEVGEDDLMDLLSKGHRVLELK